MYSENQAILKFLKRQREIYKFYQKQELVPENQYKFFVRCVEEMIRDRELLEDNNGI